MSGWYGVPYAPEGPAVPASYWAEDCPCALAGDWQEGCRDHPTPDY